MHFIQLNIKFQIPFSIIKMHNRPATKQKSILLTFHKDAQAQPVHLIVTHLIAFCSSPELGQFSQF